MAAAKEAESTAKAAPSGTVSIKLSYPRWIDGTQYQVGDKVDVESDMASRMIGDGLAVATK